MSLRLGKSGLKISKIILGTMSYGSSDWQDWVLNEEEALPLLEHAYKSGINTWDTVTPLKHRLSVLRSDVASLSRPMFIRTACLKNSSARP